MGSSISSLNSTFPKTPDEISMSIEDCHALVAGEMSKVDAVIHKRLQSDVALINQLSGYIINNGGKRLRPQLVLLAAGACGYAGEHHITVAAIIEFIHTATLLHDDVVDASDMRRGQDTVNAVWGNEAAVLVGDFLYSRSFEMMVEVQSLSVMNILASTTNRIAEGEVMQLLNVREPDVSEAEYVNVIEAKTARLFEAAAMLGAELAAQPDFIQTALANYGKYLGTAFQIVDDVLDYSSSSDAMGKNIGDDLAEGKTTLPLIYAMRNGTDSQRAEVAAAITGGGLDSLPGVMAVIKDTDSIGESMKRAEKASNDAVSALSPLSPSRYKDALIQIARYSVERSL